MPFDDDDRDRARSGKVLFHHASYVGPAVVVREEAKVSSPLVESKYRVVGKLFTDDALVEAWISGHAGSDKASRAALK